MNENTARRLARLRMRPLLRNWSDDYLAMQLDDALTYFLDFTHREVDPGVRIDSLICRIATVYCNQTGIEGATHVEDGEIKRDWADVLPTDLQRQMKTWRLIPGIHAVHGQ